LLSNTFDLFVTGLESNLKQLQYDQLNLSASPFLKSLELDGLFDACSEIMKMEFFSLIVGMFEMNNISLEVLHPISALKEEIEDEKITATPELTEFLHAVDTHVEEFADLDGTALFSLICTMNHSCDPNVTVIYDKDGTAILVALRDIQVPTKFLRFILLPVVDKLICR